MDTIGSYDAKTHLPALLDRVANGERIIITKHGVPVAALSPVDAKSDISVKDAIERIKALGKERNAGESGIREMIEEGRRF